MIDKQLHKFYLSFKLDGEIVLEWVEGINLRHAKDKIQFKHPEASDLMDWTNETDASLKEYLRKSTNTEQHHTKDQNIKDS